MVAILRYTKYLAKFAIILAVVFVIFTYQNGPDKRRRIRHFSIWQNVFKKRLTNIKYILVWSKEDAQLDVLKKDYEAFTENKCTYNNCFVTNDRDVFDEDYRNFDAIVMSAKFMYNRSIDMPAKRFPNQTYIFASSESADYYPVCDKKYDGYFNMTWTYKLNSDVPWPYFLVYDRQGQHVSPRTEVKWISDMKPVPTRIVEKIADFKRFAVAWFASNCHTNSKRETYVVLLKTALKEYGLEVDVVGKCGTRSCPIKHEEKCLEILKQYYFYLAFENSITEDYVTEKVLRPLLSYTVPVVLGGAKYSRFLPPHTYINGYKLGPKKTAAKMAGLIRNRTAYLEYFRWRNHYMVKSYTKSVCKLCKVLNKGTITVYNNFRHWWNPNFNKTCKIRAKRSTKKRYSTYKLGTSCAMDEAPNLKALKVATTTMML